MTLRPIGTFSRDTLITTSRAALAACVLGGIFILPAFAQDDSTAARMTRMEAQMDTLSRAVFKGDVPASAMPTPITTSASATPDYQASVEARLSDLEKQNRDLTGKLEQLTFENSQLKTKLEKALTDIDLRFQGQGATTGGMIDNTGAAKQGNLPVPTDDMTDTPPKQTGTLSAHDMGGPVLSAPTTPAAPSKDLGAAPKVNPKDVNAPAPADSPTIKQLGTLNQTPGGASIPTDAAKDSTAQYEMAFSQLKSGNNAAARTGFESFLKNSPTHPLAANATYWLGESYYGQGEYEKAARVFAESYKKYPQGPKVADSLLKMGMSLGAAGKKKEGCVTLQQLKKEFPTGQGVTLRRADQEIAKLGCNG